MKGTNLQVNVDVGAVIDVCYNVQLMRLFVGEPVWTAYNRPQEDQSERKGYIKSLTEKVGVPLAAH